MCQLDEEVSTEKLRNMLNCLCSRIKVGERVEAWHHDLKRFVRCFMDESEDGWYEVRYALADIGTMDGANGISPHTHSQTAHATKANATESATISTDVATAVIDGSKSTKDHSTEPATVSDVTSKTCKSVVAEDDTPPIPPSAAHNAVADDVDMTLYTSDTTTLSFGLARRPLITIENLMQSSNMESHTVRST